MITMEIFLIWAAIFIAGMIATCGIIKLTKLTNYHIEKKRDKETELITDEQDGWIKLNSKSLPWRTKKEMDNWLEKTSLNFETANWLKENAKGYFYTKYCYGNHYIQFRDEEDAVAFKLRWR